MAHVSSKGYVKIYVGRHHHLADKSECAYLHRIIAEKALGRRLRKGEKVHHWDENKRNNKPSNLKVEPNNAAHKLHHRKRSDLRIPGEPNPLVLCLCGCKTRFKKFDSSGRPRSWIRGHRRRKRQDRRRPGQKNVLVRCACRCGRTLLKFDSLGRARKLIQGHQARHLWSIASRSTSSRISR